ncbi:MAG: sodium:proton antiporter [Acidobacteriota bacterium]
MADLGTQLPVWSALPFAGILLSIALFPLLTPRFWHHHYPKVSLLCGSGSKERTTCSSSPACWRQ